MPNNAPGAGYARAYAVDLIPEQKAIAADVCSAMAPTGYAFLVQAMRLGLAALEPAGKPTPLGRALKRPEAWELALQELETRARQVTSAW